jgi:F-type H+-transporting ATPase subunit epsilon
MITASGSLGEFAVLPGHASFLTSLKIGELTYTKENEVFHLALNWGYFEVVNDTVTILVETAERADEIDLERARAALGRAEEALKGLTQEAKDLIVYEAALQRALIRMQVAAKAARK